MIEVEQLRKSFGETTILHELSFATGSGTVALLGPNGAGKTTLLQLLCGLARPDSGRITIAGFDRHRDDVAIKRILGYQPEYPGLHPMLRPRELYAAIAAVRQLPWSRITETAERFGAMDLLERRCGELSQGQKRLVTLIAAIAHRPRVLLLDEPTNALDPHRVVELKRYLTSADAPEMTLVSTHQLDFVANLTDRFLLLSEGHLAGSGTLQELRNRFELEDGDLEQVVLHATKPR
jgi:ABC-2 type transport system ATP-binding protein